MNTPEALSSVVSDLIRRGLPSEYAQRAASEFGDHHRDLVEELHASGWSESQASDEASRRLGNTSALVKNTVREYQRRYWCARWPLITFLLGPIPLLIFTWITATLGLYCICIPLEKAGVISQHLPDGTISTGEWLAAKLFLFLYGFAAPAAAMYLLARWARRAALNWKWLALSSCIVGLSVGMLRCQFAEPALHQTTMDGKPIAVDQGVITFGFPLFAPSWLAAWNWYTRDLQQICQVLLPLGFAAIVVMRAKRVSQRTSLSAASYPDLQGGKHEHARVA